VLPPHTCFCVPLPDAPGPAAAAGSQVVAGVADSI